MKGSAKYFRQTITLIADEMFFELLGMSITLSIPIIDMLRLAIRKALDTEDFDEYCKYQYRLEKESNAESRNETTQ